MGSSLYLLGFLIPLSTFISLYSDGLGTWSCVVFAFIIVPVLDVALDTTSKDFDQKDIFYYDLLLYLQVPIQYMLLFLFCQRLSDLNSSLEMAGIIVSMGINCGVIGINVAHELGHRSKTYEVWMAKALLISSLYYQFFIDHNKGHHKYVSTPQDPSSAAKGESLYRFVIKSIYGTFKSAYTIDKEDLFLGIFLQILLCATIFFTFSFNVMLAFVLSATLGFLLLECVNYIEHYGLQRKLNPSGRYEKVTPLHSWNSNHLVGRGILFNLSRHSDHHAMVAKKYQTLESQNDAPQMPTGYPGMILLSLIPKLWFRVMDKRIPKGLE